MSSKEDAIKAVGEAFKGKQFLLFRDGWHGSDDNFKFAWSKEVINAGIEKGVRHYCVEYPVSFQPIIDGYVAGKIPRDVAYKEFYSHWTQQTQTDRANTANNFIDMLDYTKTVGVEVNAVSPVGEYSSLRSFVDGLRQRGMDRGLTVAKFRDLLNEYANDKGFEQVTGGAGSKSLKALAGIGLGDRSTVDSLAFDMILGQKFAKELESKGKIVAANVKAAVGDEKAFVCIGDNNSRRLDDLDENLGKDKVGNIYLTPNGQTYNQINATAGKDTQEFPATIIYTDLDKNKPGHEIYAFQAEARKIGAEIPKAEFGYKTSPLDLTPQQNPEQGANKAPEPSKK